MNFVDEYLINPHSSKGKGGHFRSRGESRFKSSMRKYFFVKQLFLIKTNTAICFYKIYNQFKKNHPIEISINLKNIKIINI